MPASSKKNTPGETNEDSPPNRNVKNQSVGVLEADPVNSDINEKICKICSSLYLDENRLLIHLVIFHFEVKHSLYSVYFPCHTMYLDCQEISEKKAKLKV